MAEAIKKLPEHSSTDIPEAYHGKEESRHIQLLSSDLSFRTQSLSLL